MAGSLSQDQRAGKLTTPAGDTELVLSRFDGVEGLSKLFEFHVEAYSEQANIDFNALLGRNSCVSLQTVDSLTRYFNGVLVEARWTGQRNDLYTYRLVLKPWLWLLSLTSDCRIFSSMKVTDIIKKVFDDRHFSGKYRDEAHAGSYPTLEYCVQYRETDLDFVSRLMEEYGIYYFFEHDASNHTLVLADGKASHKAIQGLSSVPFIPRTSTARRDKQLVDEWIAARAVQTGRWVLNDYDYNKPGANLLADADAPGGYEHDKMEMYDCPGDFDNQGEGKALAKVRLEADQSLDHRFAAVGAAPSLFAGGLASLEQHPTAEENREYLIVRCSHIFGGQEYRSTGGGATGEGHPYAGSYEFTPSDRQFRAPLLTSKAVVQGVQSALVVGKQGEEIDVDELGRIAVVFYWDRKKSGSRRIRVAQQWAGKNIRGFQFFPRIGDEVLVQYEDGDPDRPVVVGSVYNSVNQPTIPVPAQKTKSGLRTDSSLGHSGYNFLTFEDLAGSEYIKVRAQKDLLIGVLNDEFRQVTKDHSEEIGGNAVQKVGGSSYVEVNGSAPQGGIFSLVANQAIVLSVHDSSIRIDETGITLTAPNITFNADAALTAIATDMTLGSQAPLAIASEAMVAITAPVTTIMPVLKCTAIAWSAAVGLPPVPAPPTG
jgi:type VI secretion system secreted protein VgrG